jgi:hypothetical protein
VGINLPPVQIVKLLPIGVIKSQDHGALPSWDLDPPGGEIAQVDRIIPPGQKPLHVLAELLWRPPPLSSLTTDVVIF